VAGDGVMAGVTYVQRLKTVGCVAPTTPACATGNVGTKTTVPYSADYVFFRRHLGASIACTSCMRLLTPSFE
jgi:hypothetical protein